MKAITTAALAAAAVIAAAGCTSATHAVKTATGKTVTPAAASSTAPAPAVPSPDGRYSGSCDVSLSSALYGQDYLTADVRLRNTGNVGTITRVRVSWGQQGFSPITMTRTVHVRYHASKTVPFHYPASQEQISRFQDVQLAGGFQNDGCKYRATNIGTFGAAH